MILCLYTQGCLPIDFNELFSSDLLMSFPSTFITTVAHLLRLVNNYCYNFVDNFSHRCAIMMKSHFEMGLFIHNGKHPSTVCWQAYILSFYQLFQNEWIPEYSESSLKSVSESGLIGLLTSNTS